LAPNGGWRMEDGGWRMENREWRVENREWRQENGYSKSEHGTARAELRTVALISYVRSRARKSCGCCGGPCRPVRQGNKGGALVLPAGACDLLQGMDVGAVGVLLWAWGCRREGWRWLSCSTTQVLLVLSCAELQGYPRLRTGSYIRPGSA
jgi:hypothetical protein